MLKSTLVVLYCRSLTNFSALSIMFLYSDVDKAAIEEVLAVFLLVGDADNKEGQRWQQGEAVAAAKGRNRGRAASVFWGDYCDREGRRDKGTSVVEEGTAEEEVAVAATTEQGYGRGGLGCGRSNWEEKKGAVGFGEGCGRGDCDRGKKRQRTRTVVVSVRALDAIEEEERGWPVAEQVRQRRSWLRPQVVGKRRRRK
ncbi:hypothetical protein BHE74_00034567 [Ensete ventricosum]|nr:hypothetical protein BHE74_00034567 [Ensete ventricosum]